jgi:carboxymethylenebutenolidase
VAKVIPIILLIAVCSAGNLNAQEFRFPDTVSIQSSNLILKALFWRPVGKGPFATIIFTLGSYPSSDTIHDPVNDASVLGSLFAGRGYNFLAIFRRGMGLSKMQGLNSADQMEKAFKLRGEEGRNEIQLRQLETDQLQDMIAGLTYLRKRPDVDTTRLAVIGHSFGGSLTLLVAEHEPCLKAVVIFSAAGYSWNLSPQLRIKLIGAVKNINAPIMIIHAINDYSTTPGYALDSVLSQIKKPHLLKIYPKFGNSSNQAHNLIFLSTQPWDTDVFVFLRKNLHS